MRQQLLKPISGAALAIMLTLTFAQILASAQEAKDAQDEQLQSAPESQDEQRAEDSLESSANARKLEGVWEAQVTVRLCQTGAPLTTFRGMTSFIRGGASIGTNSNPNPPTAFGRWQYLGRRRYIDVERFFRYHSDGSFAGVQRITRNITLSRDGDNFTGTISGEIFDANNNLIGTGCATEITRRVE
ncbi:MAG: hypothetical protein H0V18_15500 [Pyrinomonadaceae bacterium]|nr:hypothetical protein [Pyrinomonadaceae bacterium]